MPWVADMHVDTLGLVARGFDFLREHRHPIPFSPWFGHVDLPRLRRGDVRILFMATALLPLPFRDLMSRVEKSIRGAERIAASSPGGFSILRTRRDLEALPRQGTTGALLSLEGAYPLGRSARGLVRLRDLGVRSLGLVHMTPGRAGSSSFARRLHRDGGLTAFGHELIEEAERLGILVDLAHTSPATFDGAVRHCRKPVIVSHTGLQSVHPSWRNLSDGQARRVADTGGVIGIFFVSAFLARRLIRATLDDVVRHVREAVRVAGVDHVGIGSDFDGGIVPPAGLQDCSTFGALADRLRQEGVGAEAVEKIMGGNVARLLAEVLPAE